jgi:hypothetical protein
MQLKLQYLNCRVLSRYGVRAFPTIFLLNSTVRVRYHGSRAMNSVAMFYKDVTGIISQSSEFCESIGTHLNIY